ncbi:MAG: CehA/McbA family metallohydrolase [Planctomycetota bacterium]
MPLKISLSAFGRLLFSFAASSALLTGAFAIDANALGGEISVTAQMHHLRLGDEQEWSNFPLQPEADKLELQFEAEQNAHAATLRLRQQDVKQKWSVELNGSEVGNLHIDENDMVVYFDLPAKTLADGQNKLIIRQIGTKVDDVRVGEITVDDRPVDKVLGEAKIAVTVVEANSERTLPARITILNEDGALQTADAASNGHLAVRPGIVYTSTGKASFGLPAGKYQIIAGRGFEYSIDEHTITVSAGQKTIHQLSIRREVPTDGLVACDTHVHTLTFSGHGDSSIEERMITIAAEGIELPIATDHNAHINYQSYAEELRVRDYFTPVIGNEVTTRTGHFNIFPVTAGAEVPDHRSDRWRTTLDEIFATPEVRVAILNHARDMHGGTIPFGPKLFNDVAGENMAGWHMGFNAMEVINSGATQTNPLQLLHDWMTLLNRGYQVTPVGCSDSHDVGRHFVGQGRTYIRCQDDTPGAIEVDQAVASFLQGKVAVSYGLLAELKVNERFQSGHLGSPEGDEVTLDLRVLGPHWVEADTIMLFANGKLIRQESISSRAGKEASGEIWADGWTMPYPQHDVHLVAIATGPGIESLHWRTAKPYQPDSTDPSTSVLGCSGAIWLDADRDGKKQSAHSYAKQIVARHASDLGQLMKSLAEFDEAVAAQAANLLQASGQSILSEAVQDALARAAKPTQVGFKNYLDAWRQVQLAQLPK